MLNFGDQAQVKDLLPVAAVTSDGNGSAVDLQGLTGEIAVILDVSAPVAGTTPTMDVKLQHSVDGSTSWADVTGGGFAQVSDTASVQKISLNKDELRRYVRIVKDISGTDSPQYLMSAKIVGLLKYPA
jgi:hypothetical protein